MRKCYSLTIVQLLIQWSQQSSFKNCYVLDLMMPFVNGFLIFSLVDHKGLKLMAVFQTNCMLVLALLGCILSPLLFTLYTHDLEASNANNVIIKYADDTAVIGLISSNHESHYRKEVENVVQWSKENNLLLNTSKTCELVIDFCQNRNQVPTVLLFMIPMCRLLRNVLFWVWLLLMIWTGAQIQQSLLRKRDSASSF